jgi:hypothetical protein
MIGNLSPVVSRRPQTITFNGFHKSRFTGRDKFQHNSLILNFGLRKSNPQSKISDPKSISSYGNDASQEERPGSDNSS